MSEEDRKLLQDILERLKRIEERLPYGTWITPYTPTPMLPQQPWYPYSYPIVTCEVSGIGTMKIK